VEKAAEAVRRWSTDARRYPEHEQCARVVLEASGYPADLAAAEKALQQYATAVERIRTAMAQEEWGDDFEFEVAAAIKELPDA